MAFRLLLSVHQHSITCYSFDAHALLGSLNDQLDRRCPGPLHFSPHAADSLLDPFLALLGDDSLKVDSLLNPFQTLPADH
jgi:hypothetical protein